MSVAFAPRSGSVGELAVFEDLGVPERDDVARVARDGDAQPADEVLPEVEDCLARRRGDALRVPACVSTRRTGGPSGATSVAAIGSRTATGVQPASSNAGRSTTRVERAGVVYLAVVEVG